MSQLQLSCVCVCVSLQCFFNFFFSYDSDKSFCELIEVDFISLCFWSISATFYWGIRLRGYFPSSLHLASTPKVPCDSSFFRVSWSLFRRLRLFASSHLHGHSNLNAATRSPTGLNWVGCHTEASTAMAKRVTSAQLRRTLKNLGRYLKYTSTESYASDFDNKAGAKYVKPNKSEEENRKWYPSSFLPLAYIKG